MSRGIFRILAIWTVFSLFLVLGCAPKVIAQTTVNLTAADGLTVYGYYWGGSDKTRPIILLFHQAGASAGEYTPIAPRLNMDGFDCLAIDQRAGGSMFNVTNQTAAAVGTHPNGFLDALKDLDAALKWAKTTRPKSKVIVWGSSYSAALVFLLAKEHPAEIAAILAFSPGEYLGEQGMVANAAAAVHQPAFITCAPIAAEEANARHIYNALGSTDKTLYVPKNGVHGSSTLRDDKDAAGAADNWKSVEKFLAKFKAPIK